MAAKKKMLDDDEVQVSSFTPEANTAKKLPLDISDGKTPINEFMSVPIDRIDPYSGKQGSDFHRYGEGLKQAMIDSIKEHGIIEPLSVRPKEGGRFELLAGESRWEHAKAAGLTHVPCHIMRVDDDKARSIFSLTNLLRRDLSIRDKINGWWHYYEAMRAQGKLNELRQSAEDKNLQAAAEGEGGMLQWRQILRYVKMHDLISPWIDRMENEKVSLRTGYRVAFFPVEIQEFLLKFEFNDTQAAYLHKVFLGEMENTEWSLDFAEEYLTKKPVIKEKPAFSKVKSHVVKAAQANLRVEDYDRAEEVISKALKLYYEQAVTG